MKSSLSLALLSVMVVLVQADVPVYGQCKSLIIPCGFEAEVYLCRRWYCERDVSTLRTQSNISARAGQERPSVSQAQHASTRTTTIRNVSLDRAEALPLRHPRPRLPLRLLQQPRRRPRPQEEGRTPPSYLPHLVRRYGGSREYSLELIKRNRLCGSAYCIDDQVRADLRWQDVQVRSQRL